MTVREKNDLANLCEKHGFKMTYHSLTPEYVIVAGVKIDNENVTFSRSFDRLESWQNTLSMIDSALEGYEG